MRKNHAVDFLSNKYSNKDISEETVRQCIYSISDNHAFLRANRDPCERMIELLKEHFDPTNSSGSKANLSIRYGKGGARLTHDHQRQYAYVLQSLTLWKEILHGPCL
jgi:galactose-1-phosphate uridylyltransferase